MDRVWRKVQQAGRRGNVGRCGCLVQPCQLLHVDQRARRAGANNSNNNSVNNSGRKPRGGGGSSNAPQTIVCGCQVQPCPVHPVLIRVRKTRTGTCDCPAEFQPCPHNSRDNQLLRVRRCGCAEKPCRHSSNVSTRRRLQQQPWLPSNFNQIGNNEGDNNFGCPHLKGDGNCDCVEVRPCAHTVKTKRRRRGGGGTGSSANCKCDNPNQCGHKSSSHIEGRIKRVKYRVRRAGCAMARCTAELAMLHLHWELASECAPCKPRALTQRLCRRQQSDNELYRSNSFKFERFERAKDESGTPSKVRY